MEGKVAFLSVTFLLFNILMTIAHQYVLFISWLLFSLCGYGQEFTGRVLDKTIPDNL
jgi:hypothetical protein